MASLEEQANALEAFKAAWKVVDAARLVGSISVAQREIMWRSRANAKRVGASDKEILKTRADAQKENRAAAKKGPLSKSERSKAAVKAAKTRGDKVGTAAKEATGAKRAAGQQSDRAHAASAKAKTPDQHKAAHKAHMEAAAAASTVGDRKAAGLHRKVAGVHHKIAAVSEIGPGDVKGGGKKGAAPQKAGAGKKAPPAKVQTGKKGGRYIITKSGAKHYIGKGA